LKILVLCKKVPYPATDGESLVIMNDIRVLRQLGHEVFMFCLNTKKHWVDTANYSNIQEWDGFKSMDHHPDSLGSYGHSLLNSHPLQIARFYSSNIDNIIKEYASALKMDLIVFQGLAMTQYLKDVVIKKLYRAHNLEHKIWTNLALQNNNPIQKFIQQRMAVALEKYEKEHLRKIAAIVTLSEEEKIFFEDLYPNQVKAAISLSLPPASVESYTKNRKGLLFIGSLDWQPNREGLDWFLKEVYPSIAHIPLTIAGKGQFESNLENVCVVTNFKHTSTLLNTHRCMIVPLLSGAGIRIKIIEAMQYGIPTISTAIGAEGINYLPESILLENDPKKWIELISNIYADDTRCLNLSKQLITSYHTFYSDNEIKENWSNTLALIKES
jgi:glycosyltransferase involved in cell wall biosynthesis